MATVMLAHMLLMLSARKPTPEWSGNIPIFLIRFQPFVPLHWRQKVVYGDRWMAFLSFWVFCFLLCFN
jgi:hypothetical protein